MSDVRGATVAGQTPIPLSLFKEQGTSTPTDIATTPPSSINTKRLPSRPVTVLTVIPCWKNQKQIKINYFDLIPPKRHTPPPSTPQAAGSLTPSNGAQCFVVSPVATPPVLFLWDQFKLDCVRRFKLSIYREKDASQQNLTQSN